ncbi:MAG: hypothetical protein JRK53_19360, partial [Deltaproteobacteria bacterium]|nr:hypothetical protein [Deltaproteobacteria bacterium]
SRENRRLQDLFKAGIRNILSSTTTMELGIDIGGLNAVLLANVPPGPANHRQRAGRAGRRSDGSAVVVTFARDNEFDRQVFARFDGFLRRELRKPVVFLHRERVIKRHLYAVLLSEFVRPAQLDRAGAMHAFGKMGSFCGVSVPSKWSRTSQKPVWPAVTDSRAQTFSGFLSSIEDQPGDFRILLSSLAVGTPLEKIHEESCWREFVSGARECYQDALSDWRDEVDSLRDAWNDIHAIDATARDVAQANAIRYQVQTLCELTVIEWFANKRFLPRYGFPINLQKLTVRQPIERESRTVSSHTRHSTPDERFRLERSSMLALNEYVPGSHVLAGGRVAISRGLMKHWTEANMDRALGLQYLAFECDNGHIYISQEKNTLCPACGQPPAQEPKCLLFPRYGYTTAAWDSLDRNFDLERIARGIVYPIGFSETRTDDLTKNDFGGLPGLRATFREEAELLIRNEGAFGCGFALCTRCGYAESEKEYEKGRMKLPDGFEKHASLFSTNPSEFCWRKDKTDTPILRNRFLAARENTDMLKLIWPNFGEQDSNALYTLGRALVKAGAHLLELDERELDIIDTRFPHDGIVIYDTAAGGAGHCFELFKEPAPWLEETEKVLFVNEEHDRTCSRACLDCLLDFSTQYRAHRLQRKRALSKLRELRP